MKIFIKYIIIVLIGVIVLDVINRPFCEHLYNTLPDGSKIKENMAYIYNDEQSDILILGASRASHHYNSEIIGKEFGVSCFNAGMDSMPIYHQYLCLLRSLDNGPVKVVLVDISSAQVTEKWMTERFSEMSPFYWSNDSVRMVIDNESNVKENSKYLYLSSFVQYNSKIHLLAELFHSRKSNRIKGFDPLPYTGKKFVKQVQKGKDSEFTIYSGALVYLSKMVNLCKANDIQLYFVVSPSLMSMKSFHHYMSNYCQEKMVDFINFSSDSKYVDNAYLWKDQTHLNARGADMFTHDLIEILKSDSNGIQDKLNLTCKAI